MIERFFQVCSLFLLCFVVAFRSCTIPGRNENAAPVETDSNEFLNSFSINLKALFATEQNDPNSIRLTF